MDTQGLLLTTAELAVAFAGFSSLIGVFSRRRDGAVDPAVVNRLRVLLDYSLITLFSCLVPFLPIIAGVSEAVVWQFSSAAWVVGTALYVFLNRRWLREIRGDSTYNAKVRRIPFLLDWTCMLAMLGNALGVLWVPSLLVYYAVQLWFLAGAATGFVLVVASVWSEPDA
jgi:hypothetical protein